jgi:hypothetical protein
MNPPSAVVGALGVAALSVVPALWSAGAGTEPDEPAATTVSETSTPGLSEDFVMPADSTMLIDDTVRLTVAVPSTWTDVATAPDEAAVARIAAATDLDAWTETVETPGVLYRAYPNSLDEAALYERYVQPPADCAGGEVVPYDDGAFAGQWWQHRECGASGEAEFHAIVASPASADVTVVVVVQLAGPEDQPALDAVLESFNFTPTATWPDATTTVPTTSNSPSTTTVPADPAPSAPQETQALVNDSGLLAVSVPSGWTEIETIGGVNDDGSYRPAILAAPNLDEFAPGFEAPGARVIALPPDVDTSDVMANAPRPDDCESSGEMPFDNGVFTGLREAWTGCTGGTLDVAIVAARPADGSFTLYAKIQEDAGGGQIPTIVDSLAIAGDSAYPTTSLPPPVTTDGTVPESLWQRPAQSDTVTVIDSLRQLLIEVPAAWRDVRLDPSFNDDASQRPRIVAALHIETMQQQWEVPGVIFIEFPYVDAATFLTNIKQGTPGCDDGGAQSFDDGRFRGLMHTWLDCGGTGTRLVTVVASPPDESATLFLEVRLPTDDDSALQTVLASFGQL